MLICKIDISTHHKALYTKNILSLPVTPAHEGATQPGGEVLSVLQFPESQVGLEHPNCQQSPQQIYITTQFLCQNCVLLKNVKTRTCTQNNIKTNEKLLKTFLVNYHQNFVTVFNLVDTCIYMYTK